jgi:hypothetical protein
LTSLPRVRASSSSLAKEMSWDFDWQRTRAFLTWWMR